MDSTPAGRLAEHDINSKTRAGRQVEGMGAIELEDERIDRVHVHLSTARWARIGEGAV